MSREQDPSNANHQQLVARSREALLRAIGTPEDLTFIRLHGNIGDELIYAGTRTLLSKYDYRELSIFDLANAYGHTALVSGCGGWCEAFHTVAEYLPSVMERFERVIVLPSSFDVSIGVVKETLENTSATYFAREQASFKTILDLCDARLACDCACFFDFRPYRREGKGCLVSYRTDRESASSEVPRGNNDISRTCDSLDEWLWTIAKHAVVQTDRAHVTIAAALLGKTVEYRSSNYHKVPAIVEYCLGGFPVRQTFADQRDAGFDHIVPDSEIEELSTSHCSIVPSDRGWRDSRRILAREITATVAPGSRFVFIGGEKIGWLPLADRQGIPFLERDGQYWGLPDDDAVAIRELERMRCLGVSYLVLPWPEFWWLEHYSGFHRHLSENFATVRSNSHVVIFDLSS